MWLLVFAAVSSECQHPGADAISGPGSGGSHFAAGKKLIQENCMDCMGGTQAGMERGIREVEKALSGGYRDRKSAYELLADAYAEMVTYTGNREEVSKAYEARRVSMEHKLYELYPDDPAVLGRYQATLTDEVERIEILKRLNRIKPMPGTQFALGDLLMKQQDVKEGLPLVRSAITAEQEPEAILNYVMRLLGRLNECGCPLVDGSVWQQKVQAAFYKATRGEGDRQAMAGFQQQFVAALEKVNCRNI
jgi:hypothetical protein